MTSPWNLVAPAELLETMPELPVTVDWKVVRPVLFKVIAAPVPDPIVLTAPMKFAMPVSPVPSPTVRLLPTPINEEENVTVPEPASTVSGLLKVVAETKVIGPFVAVTVPAE